jgi:SP family general alpha glucoside:H+ symporter-like MFS transporter
MVWFIQSWCGASFMGYSTYFYQQAGLATARAFDMSMVQYALGAIGTMLSWVFMKRFGRRSLYIWGMVAMEVLLLVIGGLGFADPLRNSGIAWAVGSGLLMFTLYVSRITWVAQ